jgi:hypothetical protein
LKFDDDGEATVMDQMPTLAGVGIAVQRLNRSRAFRAP